MAALGWLLNLGFAGGTAPAGAEAQLDAQTLTETEAEAMTEAQAEAMTEGPPASFGSVATVAGLVTRAGCPAGVITRAGCPAGLVTMAGAMQGMVSR